MDPLSMTQPELDAMAVLSSQFSDAWRPHLSEVVIAVEISSFMDPVPLGECLDKEVESCAHFMVAIKQE